MEQTTATPATPETQGASKPETSSALKQRKRSPGDTGRKPASTRGKTQRNDNELRLEAITTLTALPEGGKFFLAIEAPDGEKATIVNWS